MEEKTIQSKTTEIQSVITDYYRQLCTNKSDNLEKIQIILKNAQITKIES